MGRAGSLVLGAILGGLILTLALVTALDPPAPRTPAASNPAAGVHHPAGETPRRCRVATEADPECAAAWEAKRRRFFAPEKDAK